MGKIDLGTTKYVVSLGVEISGIVEKPDVVGAIFGQTEGLLGNDLDLRELQKTGRIGRLEVTIESKGGKSTGTIKVPSSLDKVETSILAAAVETIDRVGPCEAKITVETIEDVRISKRRQVIDRAKKILGTMIEDITPDTLEITEEVKESIRLQQIKEYGKDKLPVGPNIEDSDAIIIVEGRADVLHLLKHGIKNAIGVEGTSISQTIVNLSKQKTVTVFTDGDRGGELILRELLQIAEVDHVSRAPDGKEVEELTKKELFKSLRNKTPVEQVMDVMAVKRKEEIRKKPQQIQKPPVAVKPPQKQIQKPQVKAVPKADGKVGKFKKLFDDLSGTLKAYLLDKDVNVIKEVAVRDLAVSLKNSKEDISTVIFDGVITQRLVEIANEKKVEHLVGAKVGNITKKPAELRLFTASDMG
ncbi:MAG: DNA primase DnaG [Candidatus Hydrothermarchaeaceae archaeon]